MKNVKKNGKSELKKSISRNCCAEFFKILVKNKNYSSLSFIGKV